MRARATRSARLATELPLSPQGRTGPALAPGLGGVPRIRPLMLCGLLIVAINMRPALAEVGPVLGLIGADTHLSGTGLSLLTALPVACFGLLAPFAPRLAAGWGMERTLTAALAVLAAGMALRIGPGLLVLLGGTVLLGSGIAFTNVLLPALVKRDFSSKAGLVTGLYTTALNLAATLAAASAVPLAAVIGGGWRGAFAVWIAPVLAALVFWTLLARRTAKPVVGPEPAARLGSAVGLRPGANASPTAGHGASVIKGRRARRIIIFTATQSVIYYSVLAWLPSIFESHGISAASGGLLLAVTSAVSAPVALIVPTLAARGADQRAYVGFVASCALAGLLGLLIAPATAPWLWAVLLGIALGGAFPLALTLFVLSTRTPAETARLSTVAQAVAYVVAAGGPFAMGMLHDVTSSWKPGIALLTLLAAIEFGAGLGAGGPAGSRPDRRASNSPDSEG